jgi:hypothetical protein
MKTWEIERVYPTRILFKFVVENNKIKNKHEGNVNLIQRVNDSREYPFFYTLYFIPMQRFFQGKYFSQSHRSFDYFERPEVFYFELFLLKA